MGSTQDRSTFATYAVTIDVLQKIIDFIETNIDEPLTPAYIAKSFYLSVSSVSTMFRVVCGVALMEYIRNRRLTLAGQELLSSDTKIIDLGFKYQYDTPEAFAKAFTRFHGFPPSQVRKTFPELVTYAPLQIAVFRHGGWNGSGGARGQSALLTDRNFSRQESSPTSGYHKGITNRGGYIMLPSKRSNQSNETIVINGGKPLTGRVRINGAKNVAVALLAATALSEGTVLLRNLPLITDVNYMLEILEAIGIKYKEMDSGSFSFSAPREPLATIPGELAQRLRASYYFMGSLLGRLGQCSTSLPGGNELGYRPIDQHIMGLQALGASVVTDHDSNRINLQAADLRGTTIFFDNKSLGATINVILAACRAKGTTVLENASREPEVIEVANFLNTMGAQVHGAGSETIFIDGVEKLGGGEFTCIPDRIEAGTFMMAAAATKGDLIIDNIIPQHLESVIKVIREAGFDVSQGIDWLRLTATSQRAIGVSLKTQPYPGFPTDLQPQTMAMLTQAVGDSSIEETLYENRYGCVAGLKAMGARISIEGRTAAVEGVERLQGAQVQVTDLRAGAALLIAGLSAEGVTHLKNSHHIDRGYDRLVERLVDLGMDVKREPTQL